MANNSSGIDQEDIYYLGHRSYEPFDIVRDIILIPVVIAILATVSDPILVARYRKLIYFVQMVWGTRLLFTFRSIVQADIPEHDPQLVDWWYCPYNDSVFEIITRVSTYYAIYLSIFYYQTSKGKWCFSSKWWIGGTVLLEIALCIVHFNWGVERDYLECRSILVHEKLELVNDIVDTFIFGIAVFLNLQTLSRVTGHQSIAPSSLILFSLLSLPKLVWDSIELDQLSLWYMPVKSIDDSRIDIFCIFLLCSLLGKDSRAKAAAQITHSHTIGRKKIMPEGVTYISIREE